MEIHTLLGNDRMVYTCPYGHTYPFSVLYPTLFLWPLSDWYYDGNSWGTLWFMIANYSCLLIVFILLRFVRKVKST